MPLELCWEDAPEVAEIAAKLITSLHRHLKDARMVYCFRSVAATRLGRTVYATATKVTGRDEFLLKADFVIEVAQDTWYGLSGEQRLALIDHELMHCSWHPFKGFVLRGHDVEEFFDIIERHGHWQSGYDGWTDALERYIEGRVKGECAT